MTSDPRRTDRVAAGDGSFDLTMWLPSSTPAPAILLIQEIFGVGEYIRAVGARLAEAGYVVGAPDLYWRFAPNWAPANDQAGMEASMAQAQQLDVYAAIADCAAAITHLAGLGEVTGRPGVVGFCLGGTLAWATASRAAPAACVSYYGSGVPGMLDLVDNVTCPTLFHFGADDPYIPAEGVEALSTRIAGRPNFTINVELAGHAFDNHTSEMFWNETAANAAWAKTMAFLGRELPVRG